MVYFVDHLARSFSETINMMNRRQTVNLITEIGDEAKLDLVIPYNNDDAKLDLVIFL